MECPTFEVETATVSKEVSEPPDTKQEQMRLPRNVERNWPVGLTCVPKWLVGSWRGQNRNRWNRPSSRSRRAWRAPSQETKRLRLKALQSASENWLKNTNEEKGHERTDVSRWLLMNVPYTSRAGQAGGGSFQEKKL